MGIIDAGKGALAILIAQAASLPQLAVLLTGVAAVIGHNWPVFLGFRGGRGESTTIGVLLTTVTQPMLIVAGPAIVAHIILRDNTKAAAFIFVPLPLVCWWQGSRGRSSLTVSPCPVWWASPISSGLGSRHYARLRYSHSLWEATGLIPISIYSRLRQNSPTIGKARRSAPAAVDSLKNLSIVSNIATHRAKITTIP